MIEITALEKEIETLILLELNQNDSALSISDIQELLDNDDLFINYEDFKELRAMQGFNSTKKTDALSKCAERMTREGKLKRHGRGGSKYSQQYVLPPAPEVSAKVTALEERVVQLETFINSFATGLAKNLSS